MVPSELCLQCDICCRFPEADSPLAPYFTSDEVKQAIKAGLSPDAFKSGNVGRVQLIPFPLNVVSPGHQEGCICPSFDPRTQECAIYPDRPLDCRLYPFAVMKSITNEETVLGIDTKCPFIRDPLNQSVVEAYGMELLKLLGTPPYRETFQKNMDLIGPFQDDVIILGAI